MGDVNEATPVWLDPMIRLNNGETFQILKPLTNYRSCHDGTPFEARMVFTCKRLASEASDEEYIVKTKTQLPQAGQEPSEGPSTTTEHELRALTMFRDANLPCAPQLVAYHGQKQDDRGPLPGGYLTFTIMTKMQGHALFGKFWNMSAAEREEIVPKAVKALHSIYMLGIEPVDRGLRNLIWDPESKQCSIIDFELWHETEKTFGDEKAEMQRWGLIRTPPAKDHWVAWNQMYR